MRFWARSCGTKTLWLVPLTSLDWVYFGGLGSLFLLLSWGSLISVCFQESKVLAWALLVHSGPVNCLCVCHSNTLGVPSEGKMYRVSQECGNLFMSGENWLWFELSVQHCVNVAGIFSGSCEVCS